MKKNSILSVKIESISGDGNGVARVNGEVVFVPETAVGDEVEIVVIKELKNYSIGKLRRVISHSPHRIPVDCDVFTKCGGCVFRHISTEEEERIKTESVKSVMERIGKISVEVADTVTPENKRYRNKAQLPVCQDEDGIHCGFFAPHSHRIIDGSISCAIAPNEFEKISLFILDFMRENDIKGYNEEKKSGVIRHLYYRINYKSDIMLTVVTTTRHLISEKIENDFCSTITKAFPNITSIFINQNKDDTNVVLGDDFRRIYGDLYFEDLLLDCKFKMSPNSFFQVNRGGAELVYETAFSLLENKHYENVYDLYCGIGSIGITLFKAIENGKINASAGRLFGIEIVDEAIECAKMNADINNVKNSFFMAADSADITKSDLFEKYPPSLVILDPPRKGTTTELLDFLSDKNVSDILYISCDPATLARDLGYMSSKGYSISKVHPINLFPKTKHVECIALLCRE